MSLEANKQLVRRFYEAVAKLDFAALPALVHDDFVFYHQVDTPHHGLQGFIKSEQKKFEAFESFEFPLVAMVAEGDKVAAYMYIEAKGYKTDVFGVPPNGKNVRISLLHLLTIKDGKIVEKRAHLDIADVKRQLGG